MNKEMETVLNITTKFVVVNEASIQALFSLITGLAREKYGQLLSAAQLDDYLSKFTPQQLTSDINNFSNQWLMVYADNEPAGYALITSAGKRPDMPTEKKVKRLAGFGVLKQYADSGCAAALLKKCLVVGQSYDALWMHEYAGNPMLPYLEENNFRQTGQQDELEDLPLQGVYLIRRK
ncbi:N-acetyltransferase [Chitinophaga sp. G-6-1-13]|uniref:N-acetyltransferase n=1 Tax=Chitinophaga fulva TaxID=2728842 RepID=A0A848GQ26_9BACT|nr:GNAT family N-acetyltransferase [Chitinophaga fulva]NML39449.1 N-acetyltransferase [Chitinophaga fulva]